LFVRPAFYSILINLKLNFAYQLVIIMIIIFIPHFNYYLHIIYLLITKSFKDFIKQFFFTIHFPYIKINFLMINFRFILSTFKHLIITLIINYLVFK
jgi:hypothetical protein